MLRSNINGNVVTDGRGIVRHVETTELQRNNILVVSAVNVYTSKNVRTFKTNVTVRQEIWPSEKVATTQLTPHTESSSSTDEGQVHQRNVLYLLPYNLELTDNKQKQPKYYNIIVHTFPPLSTDDIPRCNRSVPIGFGSSPACKIP
jgi:hypothetical protein